MIRVIAIDLDDTLIAPDKHIPKDNVAALRLAEESGVRVVIVTARGWARTEPFYRDLNLSTPAIVSSGARMVDGNGQDFWLRHLPFDLARDVANFSAEHQIPLRVYVGQEVWNNLNYDPLLKNRISREKIVPNVADALPEAPYQIYTKGQREVSLLTKEFGLRGEGYVNNVLTYSDGIPELSILHPESTKGAALKALCNEWGIPREQVMAIGDSINDLSMIEWAGIGVAMSWSPDVVKQGADKVTTPGNPAGVAEAVYEALSQKKTPTAG